MHTYTRNVLTSLNDAVAAELHKLRKSRGVTQHELAAATGIPRVTIQRYETGGTIKLDELGRLCEALDEDASALFARAAAKVQRGD